MELYSSEESILTTLSVALARFENTALITRASRPGGQVFASSSRLRVHRGRGWQAAEVRLVGAAPPATTAHAVPGSPGRAAAVRCEPVPEDI